MTPGFDVIVCGSLHLDVVVDVHSLPRLDETVVGRSWNQVCGGKGGNQAVQARRAGAKTAMIGRIGDDVYGNILLANLSREGVDASRVTVDAKQVSGMSVAMVQPDGDCGAVIVSGANLAIDAEDVISAWNSLGGAKVLALQNEVPNEINVTVAQLAHEAGATVILNAAPARALDGKLLAYVDLLVVNRVEAEALCGQLVTNRIDARKAISALGRMSRSVIITLGGDGLVFSDRGGAVFDLDAVPVKVRSTHGAGDCFVGTVAAELARDRPLAAACKAANSNAAAFVSRLP